MNITLYHWWVLNRMPPSTTGQLSPGVCTVGWSTLSLVFSLPWWHIGKTLLSGWEFIIEKWDNERMKAYKQVFSFIEKESWHMGRACPKNRTLKNRWPRGKACLHYWELMVHRQGLPLTMKSCFYPLIGERIFGWVGDLVDVLRFSNSIIHIISCLVLS